MVGTLNWQGVWGGVHAQGTHGRCMHKVHLGGACARHAWGVHVQGVWGCTCKACMGDACTRRTWGLHMQGSYGGAHTRHA